MYGSNMGSIIRAAWRTSPGSNTFNLEVRHYVSTYFVFFPAVFPGKHPDEIFQVGVFLEINLS